jgi:hypothetical protein
LISVGGSLDIVGGRTRTGASPTRVRDSSERWLIAKDGFVHLSDGDKASLYNQL